MRINSDLRETLDSFYGVFAGYPEPTDLSGSPYKNVAGMFRSLKAAPLRELTHDQIGPYAGSALLTVGGVSEYKHYLPRIVEQAVLGSPHMGTDPPIIAERLKLADWRSWPQKEQVALESAFYDAWSWAVDQHPGCGADATDWLCGIAALELPVRPVLNDWASRGSEHALLQAAWLGSFVEDLLIADGELAYWAYVKPEDRQLVVSWFTSDERIDALEARLGTVDEDDRWRVDKALWIARKRRGN